jgi:hypothetical protein
MTKWELYNLLGAEHTMPHPFTASDGARYVGILQAVEREDGSGRSFNLRIANQSGEITVHLRTID